MIHKSKAHQKPERAAAKQYTCVNIQHMPKLSEGQIRQDKHCKLENTRHTTL